MSLLATLSRRWQNLTTDAKPDPPRIIIEEPKPPAASVKTKITRKSVEEISESSQPAGPVPEFQRQKSLPGLSMPQSRNSNSEHSNSCGTPKKESKPKSPRGDGKAKETSANVINVNIVNSSQVHLGTNKSYTYNMNQFNTEHTNKSSEEFTSKQTVKPMPDDIVALSRDTREMTRDDMIVIKNHIGRGWRDMARKLGYLDSKIEQFEENHMSKGVDEVIYKILLDWKQANTKDARIGDLVSIIWSCREYDCVEQLITSRNTV